MAVEHFHSAMEHAAKESPTGLLACQDRWYEQHSALAVYPICLASTKRLVRPVMKLISLLLSISRKFYKCVQTHSSPIGVRQINDSLSSPKSLYTPQTPMFTEPFVSLSMKPTEQGRFSSVRLVQRNTRDPSTCLSGVPPPQRHFDVQNSSIDTTRQITLRALIKEFLGHGILDP